MRQKDGQVILWEANLRFQLLNNDDVTLLCVLWALKGCFGGEIRTIWRRRPQISQNRQNTWISCLYRGVPRCCGIKKKKKHARRAASYLSNSDAATRGWILCPFKPALGSAGSSFLNVHNRFCVCHFAFGQPTASFFLAHPYMENPPREEGFRRSFSSGAENRSVRTQWCVSRSLWEEEGGGQTRRMLRLCQSARNRGGNGGAAEPRMLGGGGDISISIIVSHVTMRFSSRTIKHLEWKKGKKKLSNSSVTNVEEINHHIVGPF